MLFLLKKIELFKIRVFFNIKNITLCFYFLYAIQIEINVFTFLF